MEKKFYKELIEHLYDGVYYVDRLGKITFWNKSVVKMTGYSKKEVLGSLCSNNILRHINDAGDELCIKGCPLTRTLKDGKIRDSNIYLHHKEGHRVPVSVRVAPIFDKDKNIMGATEIFAENFKQTKLLEEIKKLKDETLSDELTGVGSRKFAELTIQSKFNDLKSLNIDFGILFFDMDNFKYVNDTYGHNVGDKVLKMVSKTAVNILRSLDCVCRWGGDEFVVVLPNVDKNTLEIVGEKIRIFIEKTWIEINGNILKVTTSMGGTMAKRTDDIDVLIERADALMYKSKKKGGNFLSMV